MPMKYFKVYHDLEDVVDKLSDAEAGRLFKAAIHYSRRRTDVELPGREELVFTILKGQMDRDREGYDAQVATNRENGKKGGRPSYRYLDEKPNETEENPMGYEITENNPQKGKTKTKTKTNNPPIVPPTGDERPHADGISYPAAFEKFWAAYPRKTGKGKALDAWKKLRTGHALLPAMLKALDWQRESDQWQRDGGQYIPYPATWLNQRRWEDDPPAPRWDDSIEGKMRL